MGAGAGVGTENSKGSQIQVQRSLSGISVQSSGQSGSQVQNSGQSGAKMQDNGQKDTQTQNNGQSGDSQRLGDRFDPDGQVPGKGKKTAKDKSFKKEKKPKPAEQTLDTSQLLKKKDDRNI